MYIETGAGPVLLTDDRNEAAEFERKGGCVIGLCPEEELSQIDFPEAYVLASKDALLSEAFIRKTACHFYHKPFTVAATEHLTIRESVAEDYPAIFRMLQESAGENKIFAEGFDLSEIDTAEKFMDYVQSCYRFFGFGMWTVLYEAAADAVAGWCGLYPKKDPGEDGFHVEIGYIIAPMYRQRGLAYEACRAILEYARTELGLTDIIVKTDPRNQAARGLARKLGLTEPSPDLTTK